MLKDCRVECERKGGGGRMNLLLRWILYHKTFMNCSEDSDRSFRTQMQTLPPPHPPNKTQATTQTWPFELVCATPECIRFSENEGTRDFIGVFPTWGTYCASDSSLFVWKFYFALVARRMDSTFSENCVSPNVLISNEWCLWSNQSRSVPVLTSHSEPPELTIISAEV